LADLYKGFTKKMRISRNIICDACKGTGSKKEGTMYKCKGCDGNGIRIEVQVHGNMRLQRQMPCSECNGKGEVIPDSDKCEKCNGMKVVRDSKIITVEIQRGMKWNEAISFYGESDQSPDCIAGDLIFVLKPKPDDSCPFERKGNDLYLKRDIPFIDALTGVKMVVNHLDDREILLSYKDVINPGELLCVAEQGMPIVGQPEKYGDLYVQFNVTFPDKLSEAQRKALLSVFQPTKVKVSDGMEQLALIKPKPKQQQAHHRQSGDDEEGRGGPSVQCAQQ